jgi:glycosyltransferase involved in cell wall biosynthesis
MTKPGALTSAVDSLFTDHPKRQALSAAGRRHCEENFALERVVDEICKYYGSVLASTALRRAA